MNKTKTLGVILAILISSVPAQAVSERATSAVKGVIKIGLSIPLAVVAIIQSIGTYKLYTFPYAKIGIDDVLYKIAQSEGAIAPGAIYFFYRGVKDLNQAWQDKDEKEQPHNNEIKATRSKKPTKKIFPTKKLFQPKGFLCIK